MKIPQRNSYSLAILGSLLLLASGARTAFGQQADTPKSTVEPAYKLETFTVTTATRSAKAVDQIPGAVTLITTNEVMNAGLVSEDLTTVLASTIPGYSPSREGLATVGESLRGRQPLYLFDGIPQSTPLRETGRAGLFTDMSVIDRIEVISGPSATEGLGAAGGIINYISKTSTQQGSSGEVNAKVTTQFESSDLSYKTALTFTQKQGAFDMLASAALTERRMDHDADGHLVGMDTSGSAQDSSANSLFLKLGYTLADNHFQFSYSRFQLNSNGDYRRVTGNRALGIPTTSVLGTPFGGGPFPFNSISNMALQWQKSDLFGGELMVQLYKNDEALRFEADQSIQGSRQDPALAPVGTLIDQSEVQSHKKGIRSNWVRRDLFIKGLELNTGYDYLLDTTQQRLARYNRTWVPPMNYSGNAPFAQLEYSQGPVTVRGGVRYESDKVQVDTYQTIYSTGPQVVQGGTLDYKKAIPNVGAVVKLVQGWSAYASFSEAFSLPQFGVVLRGINIPNQSVTGLVELKPIISKNKEVGLTWRGARGSFSAAYYKSTSDLGSNLLFNPITGESIVQRVPIEIQGFELTAEAKISKTLSVNVLYSTIDGKTAVAQGAPLDLKLTGDNQGPDKLVGHLNWKFAEKGRLHLEADKYFSRNVNIGRAGFESHFTGYTLFNLNATYKTAWGELGLGVENVLNKQYIGYYPQSTTNNLNDNFYYAGRGRTISFSDTIKF